MTPPKRTLPLNPHPDHLRKEAKARLAEMRMRVPTVRLADAQFALARDYGFASWPLLMADVTQRAGRRVAFRRLWLAALAPARLDEYEEEEVQAAFFRAGVAAQIGFIFVALVGVGMVCLTAAQIHMAHAWFGQLAFLARNML